MNSHIHSQDLIMYPQTKCNHYEDARVVTMQPHPNRSFQFGMSHLRVRQKLPKKEPLDGIEESMFVVSGRRRDEYSQRSNIDSARSHEEFF